MLKGPTLVNFLLLVLNVIMLCSGQVFFKLGLEKIGGVSLSNAWKALFVPNIIIGLLLYVFATLIWFVVLSRMPLSVAYPIQSLAYIFGVIAALFIFHEPVSIMKWVGATIILVGVFVIALD
ncbi:EamA family transporter [Paenibacillus sp. FSL L8-0158]|uniref:EamA family transporter n=1 Tax=Paenibacillus sp. FSL L8-0158 TaxID=2954752 RepID=UPI0031585B37